MLPLIPRVTALTLGLGFATAARAGDDDPCVIVWGLAEIRERDRPHLHALCRDGTISDRKRVLSAIFRMVSPPATQVGALASILAPRAGASFVVFAGAEPESPGPAAAQRRIDELAVKLNAAELKSAELKSAKAKSAKNVDECAELRQIVADHMHTIESGGTDGSPFLHSDPAFLRCLGDEAALTDVHLVALRADNIASLLVVAATPDMASATWLAPDQALSFGEYRFFVLAVPPSAAVAVAAKLRNVEIPATWRGMADADRVAWERPPSMACVTIDATVRAEGTLFIDGVAVPAEAGEISRTLAVSRDDHQIVVIECEEGDACYPRYQDHIDRQSLPLQANACLSTHIDIGGRPRPTVAVLGATQGDACSAAPLGADLVRRVAAEYLRQGRPSERYAFGDLSTLASMSDALVALRGRLGHGDGGGAATASDGVDLIGGAAKAAWRQGIDVLLSFQLQCVREGEEWRYSLEATRIFLSSMFQRGQLGGGAVDLDALVEVEFEEWTRPGQFETALEMTIDRSLGLSYVRFLHERLAAPYRRDPELLVAAYARPSETGSSLSPRTARSLGSDDAERAPYRREPEAAARSTPPSDREAADSMIERSLWIEYTRSLHERAVAHYRHDQGLLYGEYSPPRVEECTEVEAVITARRIAGSKQPDICRQLHAKNVRDPAIVESAQRRYYAKRADLKNELTFALERGPSRRGACTRIDRTHLGGSLPGWYLVLARQPGRAAADDAICVELTAPKSEVWADIVFSSKDLYLLPRENPEVLYLRARVGYSRYLKPWLGIGAFLGYTYTSYGLGYGRPAWEDLSSLNSDPLRWQRNALLAGGVVDLRLRLRGLPFDVHLRAAPNLSVGFLNLRDIDPGLIEFLGETAGSNRSSSTVKTIDFDFNLHFDLAISYGVGPVTISNLILLGIDAVNDRLRAVAADVHSNAGVFLGFGAGIGGAR